MSIYRKGLHIFILSTCLTISACDYSYFELGVESSKFDNKDLRFVGKGYLGIWRRTYQCGSPTKDRLMAEQSREKRLFNVGSSRDSEVIEIPAGAIFHVNKTIKYRDCCGQGGCRSITSAIATYRSNGEEFEFEAPLQLLDWYSNGQSSQRNAGTSKSEIESYGPAAISESDRRFSDEKEYWQTSPFQFADEPTPRAKSDLDRAVDRVRDGSKSVRTANLEYIGNLGEAAIPVLPTLKDLLNDQDPTIRSAAMKTIAKIGHLDPSIIELLLRFPPTDSGVKVDWNGRHATDALLELGLKNKDLTLSQAALARYANVSFASAPAPPAPVIQALGSDMESVATVALHVVKTYLSTNCPVEISYTNRCGHEIFEAFRSGGTQFKLNLLNTLKTVGLDSRGDESACRRLVAMTPLYLEALDDKDIAVQRAALKSLTFNLHGNYSKGNCYIGAIRFPIRKAVISGDSEIREAAQQLTLDFTRELDATQDKLANSIGKTSPEILDEVVGALMSESSSEWDDIKKYEGSIRRLDPYLDRAIPLMLAQIVMAQTQAEVKSRQTKLNVLCRGLLEPHCVNGLRRAMHDSQEEIRAQAQVGLKEYGPWRFQ